jgi:hypothetical protein
MNASVRSGDEAAARVAIALAIVTVASIAALVLFYVRATPFGFINDVGNGLIGILSAVLSILLHRRVGAWVGVAAAVIGAAVAVWGSWLVMSGTTGFLLAGFVSTIGFGLIGVWLAFVAWSPIADAWSRRLLQLGRVAAVSMIVGGVAALPGALMGIDSFAAAPPWVWLFSLGWLGTYALYPAWSLSFGRMRVA